MASPGIHEQLTDALYKGGVFVGRHPATADDDWAFCEEIATHLLTNAPANALMMMDADTYKEHYSNTTDTHPCQAAGCRLTSEEHHRLTYGFMNENAVLRKKVRDLEEGRPQPSELA